MAFIRVTTTLLLALTLGLAGRVTAQPNSGQELIPLPPCRVADTRDPSYPAGYGPPALTGGASRNFVIAGQCGGPSTATAVSFNFTVVDATGPTGFLTVYPAGAPLPTAALMQFGPGQSTVVSNPANALLGQGGAISAYASNSGGTVQLIINVYGYYADVEELPGFNTAVGFNALLNNTTGGSNTAMGYQALLNNTTGGANTAIGGRALRNNTTGELNTAIGAEALTSNTTASYNTAIGFRALYHDTTGAQNAAMGYQALLNNTTGDLNTAMGAQALANNVTGMNNTAVGWGALTANTTGHNNTSIGTTAHYYLNGGSGNVALGVDAGINVTSGSNNIHIGNDGFVVDSGIIRIGTPGTHVSTVIAGIANANASSGTTVFINGSGQLGTFTSAARFKEGIEPVGEDSRRLLALRPVRFRYKPAYDDPTRPLQYGLVAEEVAQAFPELVYPDSDGAPYSVRYHLLSVLLLNELQRQQRELDELRAQVRALVGGKAAASP